MKFRDAKQKDDLTIFANGAYRDHSFPKHSTDYHEISSYLELNGEYLHSMTIFDKAWDIYISETK